METLYVVACVANPLQWRSRVALARAAVGEWLKEPSVRITLAECAYGSRGYDLADLAGARVTHLPLRAATMAWAKENLLNIAIAHLPPAAEKIAILDADVIFRRPGWALAALAALDLYPVVQPWSVAYDLGPNDEHIGVHRSSASVWHSGKPVVAGGSNFWASDGGPYDYPHPGFAWGFQRRALDRIGGLFELGGMGSGDHHMALMKRPCRQASRQAITILSPRGPGAPRLRSTASSALSTVRSSTRSMGERATAATSRAGRCSSTAVLIQPPTSSATLTACSNSRAPSPTLNARSTATSARARRTSTR
jgi:hypothetical protein